MELFLHSPIFTHGMKSGRFAFTLPVWVTRRQSGKGKAG